MLHPLIDTISGGTFHAGWRFARLATMIMGPRYCEGTWLPPPSRSPPGPPAPCA